MVLFQAPLALQPREHKSKVLQAEQSGAIAVSPLVPSGFIGNLLQLVRRSEEQALQIFYLSKPIASKKIEANGMPAAIADDIRVLLAVLVALREFGVFQVWEILSVSRPLAQYFSMALGFFGKLPLGFADLE